VIPLAQLGARALGRFSRALSPAPATSSIRGATCTQVEIIRTE
jgi:hypothetical protein